MDIRFYLSLFLRRFHWFALFLIIGSAVGVTLARVLPAVYFAQARLLVESEQIPDKLAASTVEVAPTEQLQIIQQRILTRDTLLEMANRLNIYATRGVGPAKALDADAIVEDLRERIKIVTTGGTAPRGPVQATLVSVSFEADTGVMAAAVTNEVVTLILKEDVSLRTGGARQTLEFFTQEVQRLDQELATRGAAILDFKQKNQEALPDSLEFRRNQQAAAQERLLQMDRETATLRDRREQLVRLHDAIAIANQPVPQSQQSPEERQLQALRDERAAQLAVLAPGNPKIKLLEAQIAALEPVVAAQVSTRTGASEGAELSAFDVQLADLDSQLATFGRQKAQVEADLAALKTSIEATPSNAIALDTLERDYANLRAQYDQAVANKARAETGDIIEALSKGQRISVVEQAVAPSEPARPNRLLIAGGGVGGGAALGLAVVLLLEFLNAGIRRPVDLVSGLGITPFATLPYLRTRREIWRKRLILIAVFGIVLLGIPAALWAVNTYYLPLDLILDRVIQRFGFLFPAGVTGSALT